MGNFGDNLISRCLKGDISRHFIFAKNTNSWGRATFPERMCWPSHIKCAITTQMSKHQLPFFMRIINILRLFIHSPPLFLNSVDDNRRISAYCQTKSKEVTTQIEAVEKFSMFSQIRLWQWKGQKLKMLWGRHCVMADKLGGKLTAGRPM